MVFIDYAYRKLVFLVLYDFKKNIVNSISDGQRDLNLEF